MVKLSDLRAIRRSRSLVIVCLAFIFFLWMAPDGRADDGMYSLSERFGVNVALQFSGETDYPGHLSDFPGSEDLGFGWYSDWTTQLAPERPNGIEHAQLMHTRPWPPDWDYLGAVVDANPGALWIIGNEPETRGQGQHTPQEYSEIYHDAYAFLKERDDSAQVAIGGIVMPTPLRLEWLDLCLDSYLNAYGHEMPVDVWNIHVQILQEMRYGWGCGIPYGLDDDVGRMYEIIDNCDVDIFKQLVYEFCAWQVDKGQRDKPLIISEYGVLMPSSYLPHGDDDVLSFMEGTFDHMLLATDPTLGYAADGGRLVQRWMWFSLNFPSYDDTEGGFNGGLYDWRQPEQLTVFGEFYRDYVHSVAFGEVDLELLADAYVDPLRPTSSMGQKGRLKLRADGQGYDTSALLRFDLTAIPQDAVIDSALLGLTTVARTNAQPLQLAVAAARCDWDEHSNAESWSACAAPVRPEAFVTLSASQGQVEVDMTDLVTRWSVGTIENQGLVLDVASGDNQGNVTYDLCSREWIEGPQQGPTLHVKYLYHE